MYWFEIGNFGVNCYLAGDPDTKEAILVDPGEDAGVGLDRVWETLEQEGLNATLIVNTHVHPDHIGSNRKAKERLKVPIAVHEAESPLLIEAHLGGLAFGLHLDPSPRAERILKEGDEISLGSSSLKVIHTPGHSPGGICLFSEKDRVIFTGDTLFAGSIGRTDLPGGDYQTLIRSIKEKILPLGDDVTVFPGHGPATTIVQERRFNPFVQEVCTL